METNETSWFAVQICNSYENSKAYHVPYWQDKTRGGHFNFACTGVCGHIIGKLTHSQTKPGFIAFPDYVQ